MQPSTSSTQKNLSNKMRKISASQHLAPFQKEPLWLCKTVLVFTLSYKLSQAPPLQVTALGKGYYMPPNKPDSPLLSWRWAEQRLVSKTRSSLCTVRSPESCTRHLPSLQFLPPILSRTNSTAINLLVHTELQGGWIWADGCSDSPPCPAILKCL